METEGFFVVGQTPQGILSHRNQRGKEGYVPNLEYIENGGVTSAAGFVAAGVHAGFRKDPKRLDLALVEAEGPVPAAGVFTQNVFCAAPVTVSRDHLGQDAAGVARAVVINSGVANAATGARGLEDAERMAALTAEAVGCAPEDVLVASTGVIGTFLPFAPLEALPALHAAASPAGGADAARAIMTTDTHSKECAVRYTSEAGDYAGLTFTVGGMAKGSGMIMPNMATMISVITTDAPVAPRDAKAALKAAADASFNKVTVDGDTSTNDTCILLCSGKAAPAGSAPMQPGTPAFAEFQAALDAVCQNLARQMAADGEGASKLVTVNVRGAATPEEADLAARTVANSPLVKTCIAGHDANWGRVAGALGRSGARFNQEDVDIHFMGMSVCEKGLAVIFDEEEALRRFEEPEIVIDCDLGAGDASTTVWTCDFTHEYISINGDYRS